MRAQFRSRCVKCGSVIEPGTEIEYKRGQGSWHTVCPKAAASEAKPASTEPAPFELTFDAGRSRPAFDGHVGETRRLGKGWKEQEGLIVTVVRQTSRWIAEDGMSLGLDAGHDCGWLLTLWCREATAEEKAQHEAREAKGRAAVEAERERVRREAAEKQAKVDAEVAKLRALTAGLSSTESFDGAVLAKPEPAGSYGDLVASWSTGERHSVSVYQRQALTGETVFVEYSHDFDDDRSRLYAPQHVIEASWAALAARWGETVEKAEEWLRLYGPKADGTGGCVGSDWRLWFVATRKAA